MIMDKNVHIIGMLANGQAISFAVSVSTVKRHGGLDCYLAKKGIIRHCIQY